MWPALGLDKLGGPHITDDLLPPIIPSLPRLSRKAVLQRCSQTPTRGRSRDAVSENNKSSVKTTTIERFYSKVGNDTI